MKKIFMVMTLLFSSNMLLANEEMVEAGKELHQESCTKCHGSEMYLRESGRIKNHYDLRRQISFCRSNLGLDWFPEDEAAVIEYLNQSFYKLKN